MAIDLKKTVDNNQQLESAEQLVEKQLNVDSMETKTNIEKGKDVGKWIMQQES